MEEKTSRLDVKEKTHEKKEKRNPVDWNEKDKTGGIACW
jgi:hypothetical protein